MQIAQTERLALRVFEPADRAALFEILGSPETMRLMPRGLLATEGAASGWIDRRRASQATDGYSIWAVTLRSSGNLLGNCGFVGERDGALELGYVLGHPHWGAGYATEAAMAAIEYGFAMLHASAIVATIRPWNGPSISVARRIGMHEVAPTTDEHGALRVFWLDQPPETPVTVPSPSVS